MPRSHLVKHVKRIVVKVGTSTVTTDGAVCEKQIRALSADIAALRENGYELVVVSSGAITAGITALKKNRNDLSIPEKQALAAVGQVDLLRAWQEALGHHGYAVGQILLTEDDLKNRRRFLNARHTLTALLSMNVIPIVNENDSVVVKEIQLGDNDTLSAHVTSLVHAELLILLSDVDGFYWNLDDPEPVEEISELTDEVFMRGGASRTSVGTGGMSTKLKAAREVTRFGDNMVIAHGRTPDVLSRIMKGEKIGTLFHGDERIMNSRQRWLSLSSGNGRIIIDDGAVEALTKKKKSLLAIGVTEVSGTFGMGDLVEICTETGVCIAKGLVNYTNDDLNRIKGLKTCEIQAIKDISFYNEVIHRDDMVVYTN